MSSRSKQLALLVGIFVAILIAVGAYGVLAPRSVPEGQPALVHLDAGNLGALKDSFNAAGAGTRLLVLLSPT